MTNPIESYRIEESTTDDGSGLDPNSRSIAKISGWLLAHGVDFNVTGQAPFGIHLRGPGITVDPGALLIRDPSGPRWFVLRPPEQIDLTEGDRKAQRPQR